MVRVRIAPSPTGTPHIGNTRTFLFNYLFAKANNGEFHLRIEDTDRKRIAEGAEEAILETLSWLGLKHEEKIIRQSERLEIYQKYAKELLDKNAAYEKDGAIWVKVPDGEVFKWTDLVGNKEISFSGKDIEDFVVLKADGYPTYHLGHLVDDHLMEITHVIRGEEWISSTPKHLFLYKSLGWETPHFAHVPVILGPDKTKLSKRHGAKSALEYRSEGYLKEGILNYLALLGWNPGGDREIMSLSEMIDLFKIEDINIANPVFDTTKLEWLNGVWIRSLGVEDLSEKLKEFYKNDSEVLEILESSVSQKIVEASSSRMKTLLDFKNLISNFPQREKTKDEKETAEKLLNHLSNSLGGEWENEKLLSEIRNFSKNENVPFKTIFFILTGKTSGIGILELNEIYGKEFLIKNLKS